MKAVLENTTVAKLQERGGAEEGWVVNPYPFWP